ncbi:hypothetical protein Tco_1416473, partial [Tanacetum coccineum]
MYGFKECSSCGALYNREHCCSNVSSVDNFVRDPNPISYDETPDSSQQPPRNCSKCGGPFGGLYCRQCTCERCRRNYTDEVCALCCYEVEKSFVNDSNPNSFIDSPNIFNPPPQPQTYSCEFCGNNAHYGYDCPPQVPFIYNPEPCYNQDFDNDFPQSFQSYPQQYLCCENCGGPHETFQCQPLNQNFYEPNLCYNSNSSGFDQYQPPQYTVIHQPPQETSVQARENLMKSIQTFLKKFNRISFRETPKVLLLAWEKFFEIKHAFKEKQHQPEDIQELLHKLLKDLQMISEELADYINTPNWNRPAFYEDDDEEYTIAITPVLPTEEPDNFLSIGDEQLSTIPETESDELIKSSVENLVPIPTDFDPEEDISLVERLLYDNSSPRPPEEFNSDAIIESFSPSPIPVEDIDSLMEEFDLFLTPDDSMPPGLENYDYDSEGDILFLEEFLSNDSPSLYENESFHFDVPSSPRPPAKPPDDDEIEPDTRVLTAKVVGDILELYVHMPNVLNTLPTLSPMFDTFLPFLSENDDKVFNPGILASNEG